MAALTNMTSESLALTGLQRPTGDKETLGFSNMYLVGAVRKQLRYLRILIEDLLYRIVTCSADRNAYVWVKQDDGTWKHTLVLLR